MVYWQPAQSNESVWLIYTVNGEILNDNESYSDGRRDRDYGLGLREHP